MPTKEVLENVARMRDALLAGESMTQPESVERYAVGGTALNRVVSELKAAGHSFKKTKEGLFTRYQREGTSDEGDAPTSSTNGHGVFPYPIIGDRLEVDFIQRGKAKGTVDIGLKAPDGSTWLVQVVGRTT